MFGYILAIISINLTIFNPIKRAFSDFSMTDIYSEMQRENGAFEINNDITLVDMTKQYKRRDIAKTIHDISLCKPKVLMVDLIFERHGDDEVGDIDLINSLNEIPNKVLSCKLINYNNNKDAFSNVVYSFFNGYDNYDWAYSNVVENMDQGCLRNYTISQQVNNKTMYSMAYYTACKYMNEKPKRENATELLIVYPNIEFPVVSCDSVIQNSKLLRNRIVMLGTMKEEADMHLTPIGKIPGMKIQAYTALTCLTHHRVKQMSDASGALLAFVLCYFAAFVGYKIIKRFPVMHIYWIKVFYFLLTALIVWIGFICFIRFDYNINLVFPLLGIALVEVARSHYKWIIMFTKQHTKWKFISKSIYY